MAYPNNKKREYEKNINYPSQTNQVLNTQELAKSPYGELSLTKHLYETRLQNIFDDYQKSLNILESQERSALQDAYYIREMSKKYLGEYASNVGIGDVSGNLLDIYSNYQRNVADIKSQTRDEQLNLMREYQQTRLGLLENILYTQFQIDVAKMEESERDVMYNIATGNTNGMSTLEYLDEAYKQERVRKPFYQALSQSLKIAENTKLKDITSPKITDEYGKVIDNPNFVGTDYDFNLNLPGEDIDPNTTIGFEDAMGNRYFSVKDVADNDKKYWKSSAELFEQWFNENEGMQPANGDIIVTTAAERTSDDGFGPTRTVKYIYHNNSWYRLAQEQPFIESEMSAWRMPENFSNAKEKMTQKVGENIVISNEYYTGGSFLRKNVDKPDSITFKDRGVKYTVDEESGFGIQDSNLTQEQREILNLFRKVHGKEDGTIYNNSFVIYKDKVYYYKDKKIYNTNSSLLK